MKHEYPETGIVFSKPDIWTQPLGGLPHRESEEFFASLKATDVNENVISMGE